ncbi:hypothetical protein F441_08972 [Phytophthora nicotianae CJ01A1]|uniref:Ubiquitin-like protease family profile domain-containing protein n=1 Tax=Phytophthora nicotianae CJ01A1 TaxID=1317063 RepID=W2X1Y2_PHYNI|nr:hypothetical protein F441_08972 [Phytophthora nicotianae CJ01A1]
MPPRLRNAQKRPLSADDIDVDNDSNASDGSSSEWQPSPSPPRVEMTGTTSSASEESGQICVIAPPPGETQFRSWEEFEIYLAKYQAQSFQIFRVRTNTSIAVRNGRIDAQGSSASKLSAEWENYAKTYVCTHYGKYQSQATSKRPRQETRASGCSAQINLCVQEINKNTHTFALMITKCRLEHNHTLNEYAFKSHSSKRVSLDDTALKTVEELRKAGAKKTSILKFIKDNSNSNPTPQDVRNLVRKLKASENGSGPSSSAKRLKKLFAERVDTIGIDTSIAGNVMNGFLPVDTMKSVLLGATGEKILIPVICGKNHWCSIMIDLTCKDVLIYDPMNSSYGSKVRPLADKLVTMLPDFAPRKYRVRLYFSELGVQVDSYNCGMYMLLAFEVFAGANTLSLLSRKELQYLRYRYLCMCI